ncbi:MAG TPA: class I SAM-dependent methyltransferase, partial [Dehalococcoidia bacterium]|nr:class I SAM-dependent methyltransferase [Dehalococcoidia bacterium]
MRDDVEATPEERVMSLAYKVSAYNRQRKFEAFMEMVAPNETTKILDVGFSDDEYSDSDNFLEKHYPYPENITALGLDVPARFSHRYPRVSAVQYDGKRFPFKDKAFDVCWSNAVLEHVGSRQDQILFLREVARVADLGWVTTPNKHFPVEVHTRTPLLHYLPKPVFHKYLCVTGRQWAAGDYMNLLSLGEARKLLAAANIKSYSIFKNRLLAFPLDFVIVL